MTSFITNDTLQARITRISRGSEDTAQAINLRLLELGAADASFGEQSVGYHIKRAAWEARHVQEKATIYDRYVAEEPTAYLPLEDETVNAFDELIAAPGLTPEEAVIQNETRAALQAAIDELPASQRAIARLFLSGYQPAEIADKLGISRSAVSHQFSRLCQRLAEAL